MMKTDNLNVEVIGSGYPLVFVHGGMGMDNNYFKVPAILKLAEYGVQIVLVDLSGNGLSASTGKQLSIDTWSIDIHKVVETLGLSRFAIVGHSYGALISLAYYQRFGRKDDIDKLILISPPRLLHDNSPDKFTINSNGELKRYMSAVWNLWHPRTFVGRRLEKFLLKFWRYTSFDSILTKKYSDIFEKINFKLEPYIAGRREIKYKSYDNLGIETVNIKSLIIVGDQDSSSSLSSEELIKRNGNFEKSIIHNASHFPFIEQQETFIKAVINFLGKIPTMFSSQ